MPTSQRQRLVSDNCARLKETYKQFKFEIRQGTRPAEYPLPTRNSITAAREADSNWLILTLPLSTLRAAVSSDCGMTPFSVPSVFTTDETDDGIDRPCEFSARTRNTYDVAGFSSPI